MSAEMAESFSQRSNLIQHQSSHWRRPYECSECGKSFNQNFSLIYHGEFTLENGLISHSEWKSTGKALASFTTEDFILERPYECSKSEESFKQSSSFSSHRRRKSTGERPYECGDCRKSFSHSSTSRITGGSHWRKAC